MYLNSRCIYVIACIPAIQCINNFHFTQENCDGGVPPNYQSQAIDGIKDQLKDVWPSYKGTLLVPFCLIQSGLARYSIVSAYACRTPQLHTLLFLATTKK